MKRVRRNPTNALNLPTLHLEGGLFLPDQLEKAALGKASYQKEADYLIPTGLKLKDEYSRAFQIASAQWKHFVPNLERQDVDAADVTIKFVHDLLRDAMGYNGFQLIKGISVGERDYPITALAGQTIPIVIAPHTLGLDEADPRFAIVGSGARKKSPFQLAQEFLNASDQHLWALVSNGKQIRLLRDAATLTRPSFLEFDLQDMLGGQRFAEFEMAWRLLHASRAPLPSPSGRGVGGEGTCIWESWRSEGQREGTRVRDGLRQGVTDALLTLGTGFIQHPANDDLRRDLHEGNLSKEAYFQQLLRLVYRLIFLFTIEERGILHTDDNDRQNIAARKAYAEGYAMSRLRDRCLRRRARDSFDDLWISLRIVFRGLAAGEPRLALPALGGLFADNQCPALDNATLSNANLLAVIQQMRWSNLSGQLTPVDYRNMGPEELGSVYESLLELVPEIDLPARQFGFVGLTSVGSTQGNARKTSGSYYTPDSLVQELIKSALDPVIEDRLANNPAKPIDALLSIKVIDPACGSGHFLLAAARRLGERLAAWRATDGAVKPQDYRHALREVISKCIFGVDRNPMALELARTALWLEGFEEGVALSFLDHHLQCGDALIGLTDLNQLQHGIPDAAFKPLSGDDKAVCRDIAKANKEGLKAFSKHKTNTNIDIAQHDAAGLAQLETLEALPDTSTADIAIKEAAYRVFLQNAKDNRLGNAANLLVGAFLIPKTDTNAQIVTPTSQNLFLELFTEQSVDELTGVHQSKRLEMARQACAVARVLHWPLAFPQVYAKGGFDCVLGNPPWERIKLQEEEFFATRNRFVAEAKNKAERGQRIDWLAQGMLAHNLYPELEHPLQECEAEQRLYQEFISARRTAEAASIFAHVKGKDGGRYPLTGVGDVNTYALFAETISQIINPQGRAGFIVPSGIATDETTKNYFEYLTSSNRLVSLYSFENEEFIFPGIANVVRFSLLTASGASGNIVSPTFCFYLRNIAQLSEERRIYKLSWDELCLFNPNNRTAPIFRSEADAKLTKSIYSRFPIMNSKSKEDICGWKIKFMTMFHMANDSGLFHDKKWVTQNASPVEFSRWKTSDGKTLLPLYEGKFVWLYDHRFGSYHNLGKEKGRGGRGLPITKSEEYIDPNFSIEPENWLDKSYVSKRLEQADWNHQWLLGFRDVTSAKLERTMVATVIASVAVGHKLPLVFLDHKPRLIAAFLGNLTSLTFDFVTRQKIGGTSMGYAIIRQLPFLRPEIFDSASLDFIVPRVLELTYTAHDLQAWAQDLGYNGLPFTFDPDRRAIIRAELDAWYAHAYGLTRDELRYVLDPADVMGEDYPSETFRVLKNNELRLFGEYRTGKLVLQAFDRMALADAEKKPFESLLVPPPGQKITVTYSPHGVIRDEVDARLAGLMLSMIKESSSLPRKQLDLALIVAQMSDTASSQLASGVTNMLINYRNMGVFDAERTGRSHNLLRYLEDAGVIRFEQKGAWITAVPTVSIPDGIIFGQYMKEISLALLSAAQTRLQQPSSLAEDGNEDSSVKRA
ncbi:MAG: restriction endonuclease [Methylobacter sp.]|nr:MAG: restriction endonuclease [Methylobacter sp.]